MSKYNPILCGGCVGKGHTMWGSQASLDLLFKLTVTAPAGLHSPQGLAIMQKSSF